MYGGLLKTILVLLMLLFSVDSVFSYNMISQPRGEYTSITDIRDLFVIKDNNDLYVDIIARVWVSRNVTDLEEDFSIYFDPREMLKSPPIEKLDIVICESSISGGGFYDKYLECQNEIPFRVEKEPYDRLYSDYPDEEYNDYYIKFSETPPSAFYMRLNFTLKDHIIKKGDYYLLTLDYPYSAGQSLHEVTFSPTAIPYKMPENSRIGTFSRSKLETEPIFYMEFDSRADEGRDKDVVWYYDEVEREQELIQLQEESRKKGVIEGAIVGGVVSLIISLFILICGGRIKKGILKRHED